MVFKSDKQRKKVMAMMRGNTKSNVNPQMINLTPVELRAVRDAVVLEANIRSSPRKEAILKRADKKLEKLEQTKGLKLTDAGNIDPSSFSIKKIPLLIGQLGNAQPAKDAIGFRVFVGPAEGGDDFAFESKTLERAKQISRGAKQNPKFSSVDPIVGVFRRDVPKFPKTKFFEARVKEAL